MSQLQQAIASGQVSAAQIEAHRAAGELPDLPIVMFEPMASPYVTQEQFDRVFLVSPQPTLRAMIEAALGHYWDFAFSEGVTKISRGSEANAVLHNVRTALDKNDAALRAALLDADKWQGLMQVGVTETQSMRCRKNGSVLWFGPSVESAPNGTAIYAAIKGAQS